MRCRKIQPTITASPENYIWWRCLSGAGAKRIQAVKGVIPAVARRREGIAALRIPAVNVAAVSDTALRALNVISLLSQNKTEEFQIWLQHTYIIRPPVVRKATCIDNLVWKSRRSELTRLKNINRWFLNIFLPHSSNQNIMHNLKKYPKQLTSLNF